MKKQEDYPVKIRDVRVKRPNGTTYVERRHCQYDPNMGGYRILKTESLGKIDPETGELVPCRPKRPAGSGVRGFGTGRESVPGASELMDRLDAFLGLGEELKEAFGPENAAKLVSIARFYVQTKESLDKIETWQLEHDLPYADGMTWDLAQDLYDELGADRDGIGRLFHNLSHKVGREPVTAYETRVFSRAYVAGDIASDGPEGRRFQNWTLISFFSKERLLPCGFYLTAGSAADIVALAEAAQVAIGRDLNLSELVLGQERLDERDLHRMKSIPFLTWARLTDPILKRWLHPESGADMAVRRELRDGESISPTDPAMHGVTRTGELAAGRVSGAVEKEPAPNSTETSSCIHVHIYRDANMAEAEREGLKNNLAMLTRYLEKGADPAELPEPIRKRAEAFLTLDEKDGKVEVRCNAAAIEQAMKNAGLFALLSNVKSDHWDVLDLWKRRSTIERAFPETDTFPEGHPAARARMGTEAHVRGRELCRIVALAYHFSMKRILNRVLERVRQLGRDQTTGKVVKEICGRLEQHLAHKSVSWFFSLADLMKRQTSQGAKAVPNARAAALLAEYRLFLHCMNEVTRLG